MALKQAAPQIYSADSSSKIHAILLSYLASDRIAIVSNGIRSISFFLTHLLQPAEQRLRKRC